MADLIPLTALGSATPARHRVGALELTENAGLGLASLALRRDASQPVPFGLDLPAAGKATANAQIAAFWTGPGQWMIEGPGRAGADFAAEIAAQAPGCSVTEQTDGFAAFEVKSAQGAGPILAFLAKLANIDVTGFGPGSATRTGFEHMSIFVIRRAEDHIAIIGMRSAAGSIWHALETAAERLAQ